MTASPGAILPLDKPAGLSSAGALERVKRAVGIRKAGHAGTLDPFATGLLVCCMGRATRLARFFLHGEKRYEAVLCLGAATDTEDATGRITSTFPVPDLSPEDLMAVFHRFEGEIEQAPPAYSALKHEGVPLYRLARAGRAVRKPPRPVRIHRLRILDVQLPEVRFEVACSGGTYIRTLCADIGRELGCGGHLNWLRRTYASGFDIGEAVPLEGLEGSEDPSALLIPAASALRGMPEIRVGEALAVAISSGKPLTRTAVPAGSGGLTAPRDAADGRHLKVLDPEGRLLAVVHDRPGTDWLAYDCVFPAD